MDLVTAEQMRAIDRHAIDALGLPAVALMENAGRAVAEETAKLHATIRGGGGKPWLVLVGKGNNGGDGIVAARHLIEMGIDAELLFASPPERLEREAALQRDVAVRLGIRRATFAPGHVAWHRFAGVVDGLLGTGTSGDPREPYASLIREANESGLPIVAIDVPSGLNADTGATFDPCIRATVTVSLGFVKLGAALHPGADAAGNVVLYRIGIPERLAAEHGVSTYFAGPDALRRRFGIELPLPRAADTHKGTYGHVLLAAGSAAYGGAGWLAAKAALRSGAGLATWALPERAAYALLGRLPEAIVRAVPDDGAGGWSRASADRLLEFAQGKQAFAVGPGIGRFEGDADWLRRLWTETRCPLVLDADALNILADAGGLDAWPRRQHPTVLTPHPGEMARLVASSTKDVQRDRLELARRFARERGVTLVLKGARSIVALPNGECFVNSTGNPAMATGGAGDALTGVVAGLIAQGLSAEAAAVVGVYWHGAAGDRAAAARTTPASLLAGDIIEAL